ncbi:GDSL-type esterase/lipase family protein [Novosphingobium sp. FKTRR1]|uniref:GDSL-type esterase/lipase family protein n=1 Tax=Novosphingobium sp. FKTRR1 TaxID=2879118 RepID=UPI001CF07BC7|nr:GDSL-type esterase/lipase family protein [Novosphingobium sp. FKTRR1]
MRRIVRAAAIAGFVLQSAGHALAQAPVAAPQVVPPGTLAAAPSGPASAMVDQPCALPRNAQNDWPALCRYQRANRQLAAPPRVVMIGDSITEWWLTTSPGMFAGGIVDRGIAGQTSPQILLRFYQDVVRLKPRVVHIMCGTNDVAGNTGPTSPEEYTNAIRAMVDLAQANGIAVVIGSVLPAGAFNWRAGYRPAGQIVALNVWLRDFARLRGAAYADYHGAMTDPQGAMKPGLSSDGVHPNAAGYAVMEPIARAAIAEALKPAPQTAPGTPRTR